ncbi:uroporphyrinogen decarboxylase family protein [Paralcaligenes ureilyticus]|uniref:Uroporphyrinogen decarboxylase n=1 Tax=Paralcaligenes ureilyticus TaxID=627131 RepID=A0A4V2UXD3_9BURK|nr:uroporphyrinogen decarboxylase family protein [Paralcaligenes ureilyticus]TCT03068.1 uroporphyrinogen decarboxylase [Paralcaligenes ureilyticus]
MNKKQRFMAVAHGTEIDRPPVTAWVHFQSDHLSPEQVANLHYEFFRAYDWDILKVMNDYRYPVPEGVVSLTNPEAFSSYSRLSMDTPCFAKQLDCLERLRALVGDDVPILETVFEPYQQILRNIGYEQSANFFSNEKLALSAIEAVTETMCDYVRCVKRLGIDGIYLSINGAIPFGQSRGVTDELHETFQKPFASRVLDAAEGMVRVLHAHGHHLQVSRAFDYPHEILSVSTCYSSNPSLKELCRLTDKPLMGGVDETTIQEMTLPQIEAEVCDAKQQMGDRRWVLAPGCTMPSFTPVRNLKHLRAFSKTL